MPTFSVSVTYRGEKHTLEYDEDTTGEDFKAQLYSLTGIEPDNQKVMMRGKMLKDDAKIVDFKLRPKENVMMMATGSTRQVVRPAEPVKFIEDMTAAEAAQQAGATPAGLRNLGNTCYLNATLQTLRSIPELNDALSNYQFKNRPGVDLMPQLDLTNNLRDLYKQMGETQDDVVPFTFLNAFRGAYPQFAERARNGQGFAQQDAEEAWSQIVSQLKQRLQITEGEEPKETPWVDRYMGGEFTSIMECDDAAAAEAGEQAVTTKETFLKLNCHIDATVNHLVDGLKKGLLESGIEKRSEALGRESSYTKRSKISRLPKYLVVHLIRFFWKRDVQKKAKIMRKVTFPHELDATEYCTEELRKALVPVRDKVREIRKDEEDVERARKRRKKNSALDGEPAESTKKDEDVQMGDTETFKTDAEFEAEKDAALLAAKKELYELIDPELRKQDVNQSGLYELRGVVTHQGASADSGHYTCYVKKTGIKDPVTGRAGAEDGKWWWFNDDKVTEVSQDKIDALAGGGESHSALILLYRAIPLPSADGVVE